MYIVSLLNDTDSMSVFFFSALASMLQFWSNNTAFWKSQQCPSASAQADPLKPNVKTIFSSSMTIDTS